MPARDHRRLALIIPCFNEAKSLRALVARCAIVAATGEVEVILVDNGSTDATTDVLPSLLEGRDGVRAVRVDVNQGYGHGILAGLRAADADLLGWTHADLQTDPIDILRALPLFDDERVGFVKGRRSGRPLGDVAFTIGMSIFESALLRTRLWDINAQPTVFRRRFFDAWSSPPTDFSLDLYAYYHARKNGVRVRRFPVVFGARQHGVSHWNVDWRSKARFIRRTVAFSLDLRRRGD